MKTNIFFILMMCMVLSCMSQRFRAGLSVGLVATDIDGADTRDNDNLHVFIYNIQGQVVYMREFNGAELANEKIDVQHPFRFPALGLRLVDRPAEGTKVGHDF